MPLVSTLANASSRGYRIFAAGEINSYESIATATVGSGGSSSISFSSIPSTYKHLQVRGFARDDRAAVYDNLVMQFNSDTTTTNYTSHLLQGNGSSASASNFVQNIAGAGVGNVLADGSVNASIFGAFVIDILDYANTNKYKTTRMIGGVDNNGSGVVGLTSGLWSNTAAISTILIKGLNGNLQQYSHFALYGIKG